MAWPQATDYNVALQNPALCFEDDELRHGQAAGDPVLGLPRPYSGNFADVYQLLRAGEQSWAVKCFTRAVVGLRERYQAISDHLRENPRPFMVPFRYLDEGIRIRGEWYPILKMRWVEGYTLNDFVGRHVERPGVLDKLAAMWLRLARELREARIAHGDLQHGNVVLVPSTKGTGGLGLRLIDYDGLWVPTLADRPSGECGHPNYQHPQRLRETSYGSDSDRFSHLVIYGALRCLAAGPGRDLWQRYDNAENLLFREADFRKPDASKLLRELWDLGGDVRTLTGQLLLAAAGPLVAVPVLEDLLEDGKVRGLTRSEEEQVRDILRLPSLIEAGERADRPGESRSALRNQPIAFLDEEPSFQPSRAAPLVTSDNTAEPVIILRSGDSTADFTVGDPETATLSWLPFLDAPSSMPEPAQDAPPLMQAVPIDDPPPPPQGPYRRAHDGGAHFGRLARFAVAEARFVGSGTGAPADRLRPGGLAQAA